LFLVKTDMSVPKVNKEECSGCGVCVGECPTEAITLEDNIPVFDPEKCTECGSCVDACPTGALSMDN
jgi:ferredoxin